ncbi:hypothetical protein CH063_08398 [Colletotrichum higginsianum]|uniref:Secreted protein n=1 Tax=Colletotrichum higginsianum (strain IMI 349063) TaxID=759273 RepID=H1V9P2_COLHI|nr:hypothetical protein CH063_08398 [Colletotrichum higginsianum]
MSIHGQMMLAMFIVQPTTSSCPPVLPSCRKPCRVCHPPPLVIHQSGGIRDQIKTSSAIIRGRKKVGENTE